MEIVKKAEFADKIYPSVNKINKKHNYKLFNSVIIAQSVLETRLGSI